MTAEKTRRRRGTLGKLRTLSISVTEVTLMLLKKQPNVSRYIEDLVNRDAVERK